MKNTYPLPYIQELLNCIRKLKVLLKINLLLGYWQLHIGELSVPKTAFNTLFSKYKFLIMPFGLCNAPATFQIYINSKLQDLPFIIMYLNDILIFLNLEKEHKDHIH
jgi:hypothetical protein